jgi:sporadic carbohydrate cluster protein (TIGR04323 family)
MKKFRGYIFSRSFMGERAPQHVQNIVIRDYCNKNSINFLLSESEYSAEGSYHILKNLVNNLSNIHGIIAYSLFQLPEEDELRKKLVMKLIKKKKQFHFAVEQISIKNLDDWKKVDQIWKIKKTLNNCISKL